ncbi:hypothetical protein AHAS_Ahas04G0117700 [Arachis hypogaea]
MEENSRPRKPPPQTNSPHHQSRDKEREPKKKEEENIEKPRKYHNYTPLRVFLVDVYREICLQKSFYLLVQLSTRKLKVEQNIANTTNYTNIPLMNATISKRSLKS